MSNYSVLDTFIIRRPRYNYSEGSLNLNEYLQSTSFGEAIYFASRDLYEEYKKYLKDALNYKDSQRMHQTLIKYLSRMTYRCTPFGGFSLCGTGNYHKAMTIEIDCNAIEQIFSIDSMDVEFLRQSVIKNMLPTELAELNVISNETLRIHQDISSIMCRDAVGCVHKSLISNNSLLRFIIKHAKNKITVQNLVDLALDNFDISSYELFSYIRKLITSGILISELDIESLMNISTDKQLSRLLSYCHNPKLRETIIEVQTLFKDLQNESDFEERKHLIESIRKTIGFLYGKSQCKQLHLDSYLHIPIKIPHVIPDMIIKLLTISECLCSRFTEGMNAFMQKFRITYEDKDMPLLNVLDEFVGIGFDSKSAMESEYIGELQKDQRIVKSHSQVVTTLTKFEELVVKKMTSKVYKSTDIINLADEDFALHTQQITQRYFPKTLSCMFKIVGYNNMGPLLSDIQFSGTSAANMLTRFAVDNQPIRNIVASIVKIEESETEIIAEVRHITNVEYGNVQRRPYDLRDYSLNYLSYPHTNNDHEIELSDIIVSLKDNEIVLYSKKLKKRIIPFCTTAYNPMYKSSTIYRFLCALCNKYNNLYIGFSIYNLVRSIGFVPRIAWNNVILSPATWTLQVSQLIGKDKKPTIDNFVCWSRTNLIPRFVCYVRGDNFLVIDIESNEQIQIFLKEVSNIETVTITEFLPLASDMHHYSSIYEIIQPMVRK